MKSFRIIKNYFKNAIFFLKKIKNFFKKETAPEKIRGLETFDLNIFYQIEEKK